MSFRENMQEDMESVMEELGEAIQLFSNGITYEINAIITGETQMTDGDDRRRYTIESINCRFSKPANAEIKYNDRLIYDGIEFVITGIVTGYGNNIKTVATRDKTLEAGKDRRIGK